VHQKLSSRQVSAHKYQWLQLCHPTCDIRHPTRLSTWSVVVC